MLHRSAAGVRRFVTAEASMFTHGVFGNPKRVRRKTMVNLWHGGGFKGAIMCDAKGRPTISSDFLVAATSQFGSILAEECALPDGGLLLTGNPRIDQFRRPVVVVARPPGAGRGTGSVRALDADLPTQQRAWA